MRAPTLPSLATKIFFSGFFDPKLNPLRTLSPDATQFIREAMFGGRTNAIHLKYLCDPHEHIGYFDVTSLYPAVLVHNYYPLAEPHTYGNTKDIRGAINYFLSGSTPKGRLSVWKCSVRPPKKHLRFPVLPSHADAALLQHLSDPDEINQMKSNITSKKLLFHLLPQTGVWTNVELKDALAVGYRIKHIKRIMYWEPTETSATLWRDYMLYFLKKKTLANGSIKILNDFNRNQGRTDLTWHDYIEAYNAYYKKYCHGVIPDDLLLSITDHVEEKRSKADYATAKLFLNSLWGRFSMRNDYYSYKALNMGRKEDAIEFIQAMEDLTLDTRYEMLNGVTAEIQTRKADPLLRPLPDNTNVAIGVFTTSYARHHLLKSMRLLGKDVLYHDTDSIIFVYKKFQDIPLQLGDFLGQWTNELPQDDYITRFYSAGPKNYAYEDSKGHQVVKCKGFNMKKQNVKACIDIELFQQGLDEGVETVVQFNLTDGGIITRDKQGVVKSRPSSKKWRCVYTKRLITLSTEKKIETRPFWVEKKKKKKKK